MNIKQSLMLLTGGVAVSTLVSCDKKIQEEQRPNIVFIFVDDLGYGDVSALNENSKIQTPNIDRLAAEGVSFTDMHSSSSVSTPSRYGLLTGRYNWRSELKSSVLWGYSPAMISPGRRTMADVLRDQGYTTACIGKWHLGWHWDNIEAGEDSVNFAKPIKNGPISNGFDYFYGMIASLDIPPYVYVENDMPTAIPDRTTKNDAKYSWWREGPTSPDFKHEDVLPNFVNRAVDYIKKNAKNEKPFFLYLPLPAPHTPILPSPEFQGKSGLNPYADFVLMVDHMVGKVQQALEESGIDENTIVVFSSDNGCSPEANYDLLKEKGHNPSYIFRGHKSDLYEGGHRVPCMVRWPRGIANPHKINQTVCLTDFYRTFAELVGYKMTDSEGEDSYNILPLLTNDEEDEIVREATVHHSIYGQFTIRQGKWKLLLSPSSGGWSFPTVVHDTVLLKTLPPVQLYDMVNDPEETTNLESKHPEIVDNLRNLMKKYIREGRSTPGAPQKNEGPKIWDEIKDLGIEI